MKEFRNEHKYLASDQVLYLIEQRVSRLMPKDSHSAQKGCYSIRSLYFDDCYDSCLRAVIDGTEPREKFRIRVYDGNFDRISLELKQKINGKCRKFSALITQEQCESLVYDARPAYSAADSELFKKMCLQKRNRLLRPVVTVCYERVPYIWKQGNVRVTFDRNIRSATAAQFFSPQLPARPVLPAGIHLLEVKYDGFLPSFIYELLQTGMTKQSSFSKYHLCRSFSLPSALPRAS